MIRNILYSNLVLVLCLWVGGCVERLNWPESGKSALKEILAIKNFSFDCYPSDWAMENAGRLGNISNIRSLGTNAECGFSYEKIQWEIYKKALNATLRCKVDNIIGEYTISMFREPIRAYGEYYCNTAHFPSSELHEIGTVTDKLITPY